MAFCSTPREPDTIGILRAVLHSGKRLCLPRCEALGVMTARAVGGLGELAAGAFGILEPSASAPVQPKQGIDLLLAPCSAVSVHGVRVGKGGGYYDRFLADYRGVRAALCCDQLVFEEIEPQPHDQPVDIVITEKRIIRCNRG